MAMMIEGKNLYWEKIEQAPGMHYQIQIQDSGRYYIWLLAKFEDNKTDACRLALDGRLQNIKEQFSARGMFTYSMKQRWNWQAFSTMQMKAGIHILSILGEKSGLRIDRIYISNGQEWPPIDAEWVTSVRAYH